jgi:tetratricopeptide (TPR) repeat protein
VKDLSDYQTVLFILSCGPYFDGMAFRLAYANKKIIDSIFKTEPGAKKIEFNDAIIRNSSLRAIDLKDVKLAEGVARFRQNSWGTKYREGYKAYQSQMLSYYHAVKDTANYLRSAITYFDQYYRLSADSIRKLDLKAKESHIRKTTDIRIQSLKDTLSTGDPLNDNEQFSINGVNRPIASVLNRAAREIKETGTTNPLYINKAIQWVRKAIELQPEGVVFYNTLAHLLYTQGNYAEAELNQNKAIDLSEKSSTAAGIAQLKDELKKMKARKL